MIEFDDEKEEATETLAGPITWVSGTVPHTVPKFTGGSIFASKPFKSILEVADAGTVTSTNHIYTWDTANIDSLFETKWEESQLYGVLSDLGLLESSTLIAGGSLVRHFMKGDIYKGDIDLFPASENHLKYVLKHFEDKGYKLEKRKFSYQFEYTKGARKLKVQVVHHTPQPTNETLQHFDFEHCRIGFHNGKFKSTMGATTALAQRKLHLRYVKEPNYSLLRALKYKRLGFDADKAINQLAVMINRDVKGVNAADYENTNPIVEY